MAIETKYGKVTIERGSIGEDEPVFILRARDALALRVIHDYASNCSLAGVSSEHVDGVLEALAQFAAWQRDHPVKMPD